MDKREENIVEAAIRLFSRYGVKRASMNDIAEEAGIARQTLYNAFSNKDEVLKATLRLFADRAAADIEAALDRKPALAERLDAVFTHIAIKPYELLHASPNAMDIIEGFNTAGQEEIASINERFRTLITGILMPYETALTKEGLTAAELAVT